MIRYSIYVFVVLSLINVAEKFATQDYLHLGVACVLVFMSLTALMLSIGE